MMIQPPVLTEEHFPSEPLDISGIDDLYFQEFVCGTPVPAACLP